MGRRAASFHDRQLVGESEMNMVVGDLTELYDEWLKDGDILAEGADGDHDLIPTPITLRSVPLRSGFDCFEDDAGNLAYVAGEPGRADWIFPPKYQRAQWSEAYFVSEAGEGVWFAAAAPSQQKYPPDGWSSDYGFDDSGWMAGKAVTGCGWWETWVTGWFLNQIGHGAEVIMSADYACEGMANWHRLMRRKFTVDVPSGTEIAQALLWVWADNNSWWYLNGAEVVSNHPGANAGPFDVTAEINSGNNLLAAQLCNDDFPGGNPMALKFAVQVQFSPTAALGEQFYVYWAQITGDPADWPRKAFCIAGAHGISGYAESNGARFYTYDHRHSKINGVWINAFVLGRFE